jgi:hypothetical protein
MYLGSTNQTDAVDVTIQNHLLGVVEEDGMAIIIGHAWTQANVIDRVEYRVGEGAWKEATYEEELEELGPLTPFNWTVALDLSALDKGEQTVEVRAVRGDFHSLPVTLIVMGEGVGDDLGLNWTFLIGLSIVLFVLLATVVAIISARRADQEPIEETIEAEILDAEEPLSG